MPRITQCLACRHPDRRTLDATLAAGDATFAEIAQRFGVTKSGLDRHWQRHAGPAAAKATAAVGGRWEGRPLPAPLVPREGAQAVRMRVVDLAPADAARASELRAEIARLQVIGGGWGTRTTLRAELAEIEARSGGMAAAG